jgi:alpha-D-ribose 1-methylphosphonate 5-triphosphate synthase subunit PhnH
MSATLTAGFADPVNDAQACFRAVMDAMARPGRIGHVPAVQSPAPTCTAAAAVLLTLVDHETPLWLDPKADDARTWIVFHTGAPIVEPGAASFLMALSLPDLTNLATGSDEAPEESATVILQLPSLDSGARFLLDGPGLREPASLAVDGLPADFASLWSSNHKLFPRGIDLILCSGSSLVALPRSVTVRNA